MIFIRKHKNNPVGYILLLVGLFLISNNIYNLHIHVQKDGQVICHAHPFASNDSNSSDENHQHTDSQLFFLDSLVLFLISVNIDQFDTSYVYVEYYPSYKKIYSYSRVSIDTLKGPPYYI